MPKGLINGDRLAKDIVENNIDVALFEDSTDPFGNRIFKEGTDDFEKFVKKVGPKGKGSKGIADAFTRVKKRTKDLGTTKTGRPPERPSTPVSGGRGRITEDPGARQEAARKAAKKRSDKRKAAIKAVREQQKTKPTKELEERGGGDRGLNKGGLMKKGNK